MNKKILTLICAACLLVMTFSLLPVHGEEKIYNSVVRLHVIANSDSSFDQELKLAVRDSILQSFSDQLSLCSTRKEAEERILANMDGIRSTAAAVLAEWGADYSVGLELDTEDYPTRNYESLAFPSGSYLSLRITLGEAEGKNWWCVLFPPLCLDAAVSSDPDDAFLAVGLTPEEYRIITETDSPKYQIRFKILETFGKLFN